MGTPVVGVVEGVGHSEAPWVGVPAVVLDDVVEDPGGVEVGLAVVDVVAVALVAVVVGVGLVVLVGVVEVVVPGGVVEAVLVRGREPVLAELVDGTGRGAARTGGVDGGPTNGGGVERHMTERGRVPPADTVRISRSTSAR